MNNNTIRGRRRPLLRPLSLALIAAFPPIAIADVDLCVGSNYTGDQRDGISVTVQPPSVLNVYDLTSAIVPVSGPGILLTSQGGANLTVCTAPALSPIEITTAGASGIVVRSTGRPTVPTTKDPLFDVALPGASDASGGEVLVRNGMSITTSGGGAHGISATSNTLGYPDSMVNALKNYDVSRIAFDVTQVIAPDGSAGGLDVDVKAAIVNLTQVGDRSEFVGYGADAGSFKISSDGTVFFTLTAQQFADLNLAVGQTVTVAVEVVLQGRRDGTTAGAPEQGRISAQIEKDQNGNPVITTWADFETYGQTALPSPGSKAQPDIATYLAALAAQAEGAGGGAKGVTVEHLAGRIETQGPAAYGIYAQSRGVDGTAGRNGGGFWSFGTRKPQDGKPGSSGGAVVVRVDGEIHTTYKPADGAVGEASVGVLAHSAGGNGGNGGQGGTYYYGRAGAKGGDAGTVTVTGSGTITTEGRYGSGIVAISEGGNGGDGGGGDIFTGGGVGSSGGTGGEVSVIGRWNIETHGADAHGIWARSNGGVAGSGGSGGWLFGKAAPGAFATDGGKVTISSGGEVTTVGDNAFALFGQSIGGFGGTGGAGVNLFSSSGGGGGSAGSGGQVSVTNEAGGKLETTGAGSHALVAQSIGGGGGAGGSSSGIVARGGIGAYGGNGGEVVATNDGEILTHGVDARGIFAQSIGGGGGDGGSAFGLVAKGGSGAPLVPVLGSTSSGTSVGGKVTVWNSGSIVTDRSGASAIYAQSIGGGGGNGGSSSGWFSIGGTGAGGGSADTVTVNHSGQTLQTKEDNATALFAQSVGGGGGRGGSSVSAGAFGSFALGGDGGEGGSGQDVTVTSTNATGAIETGGERSYGIFAQSIGGGGGDGGFAMSSATGIGVALSMAVGGSGAKGGDAGVVTVTNHARIDTTKADSIGLFAESIGGGGGSGGFAISDATTDGVAATFSLGGSGKGGGSGKLAWVENHGGITTIGDRSIGLQAQSVGGGGGNGGFSLGVAAGGLGAVGLTLGGSAAAGGSGDQVHVENYGAIGTGGLEAHAMLVQSVGGGGGNGGFSVGVAAGGLGAGTFGLGGTGGDGGDGGYVFVRNTGTLTTTNSSAIGLFAQSVGGGGGNGGFAIGAAGGSLGALSLTLGGKAADGGISNGVHVENEGAIGTGGVESHAMLVQSIGGGGGNGGFTVGVTDGGFAGGSVTLGGAGGAGSASGSVYVKNTGTLETTKEGSVGLFAQSVGGGGGNGGFAISGAVSGGAAVTFALGGSGAGGGAGNSVTAFNYGGITTAGDKSIGLQAQSVGGGGGNGGFSLGVASGGLGALNITLGGKGAAGGIGDQVHVENYAAVGTDGVDAHAMLVQSIGGGGGNGGFSIGLANGGFAGGTVTLGGGGGAGGDAGTVYVKNTGGLETRKEGSVGLFVQSLGGGGGNGGFAISGGGSGGVAVNFALGGSGQGGGDGKKVEAYNEGAIQTIGDKSIGLQAQSLGGGGGNGGFSLGVTTGGIGALGITLGGSAGAGGDSGEVHVENKAAIATEGVESHAMLVQSVGGGGGNGGFSIGLAKGAFGGGTVTLGGNGGGGGDAGFVYASNTAKLSTGKEGSVGLFAQSVGGGGGNGGFAISGAVSPGVGVSFALGGSGAGGGDGNAVEVHNAGEIRTIADKSIGLQAQSVGGGGGNGGFSLGIAGGGLGALSITLGGSAADGGIGQTVDVRNHGAIGTEGVESHAMLVQSIGGGGGNGGFSIGLAGGGTGAGTFTLGGTGGAGGAGGVVYAENTGALTTTKDKAIGLFAQSVGGGGGNGGFSIALSGAGTGAGTFNLGGKGDTGGDGNTVTVLSHGDIGTVGVEAHGVFAQSLGGGGGNGGFAITGSGAGTASGSIGIGGWGAGGGQGKLVDVDQAGRIETQGESAVGVYAQSVGGGGGNGGFSIAASGAGTASGTLTLGGYGKGGGAGGEVRLASDGEIVTHGSKAYGLFAQSVGGGGGNGGFAIGGAGAGQGSGSVAIGGKADQGGSADIVTVDSAATITTGGEGAVGLFAQSVGGGGGNGGFAFDGNAGSKLSVGVSVGGGGGAGGMGNTVHVDSSGVIETRGDSAHAIEAQSIGGGGGSGGMALTASLGAFTTSGLNATVTVGGGGGSGGKGGDVVVGHERSVAGMLVTHGDAAHGILAQSVGGGGGQGGSALALTFGTDVQLKETAKTLTATFTFGGGGGDGNVGGAVAVTNASDIGTSGADAHGIFAQSVGGGGGSNGSAKAISLSTSSLLPLKDSKATNLGLEINMAGNAGDGNKGGTVTVDNDGTIVTTGISSRGIFAQSVGGGGGAVSAGVLGKVGDWLDQGQNVLDALGVAKTLYDSFNGDASGLKPSSLSITIGANEGSGADAAAVQVTNRADIATSGLASHAIFAQSVGAGGGDAKAYAEGRGGGEAVDTGIGLLGEIVIGGAGGAAGSGGAVNVTHTGSLLTRGDQAHGIYAQSVGGGGGQAGSVAGGFSGVDSIGLGLGFGRSGGNGGNGGAVTVDSSGAIETAGERSIGILAQSVGGGGGAAAERSGLAFFGSVGGFGAGGDVSVTHTGTIVTQGARAHGVFAQSAGGSTGTLPAGGSSAAQSYLGRGGAVDVTVRGGGIAANGAEADGILAQSIGVDGGRDITITIDTSFVQGGSGAAAGVRMLDGGANRLLNGGVLTTLGGIDGTAVAATRGDDTVRNSGLMVGNVDLGTGHNAFVNEAGAGFEPGSSVRLGAGNTLSNQGWLSPGGTGLVRHTAVDGNLLQGDAGTIAIDLDVMAGQADRIDVSGTASLAGSVRLLAVHPAPGRHRIPIVSAAQGIPSAALSMASAPSAVSTYSLLHEGNDVLLDYRIDFSDVQGLNANQRSVGAYVNAIQSAGSTPGFTPIADALFAQPQAAGLANAYDHLGAEPHVALTTTTLFSSLQFGDAMLSCRRSDGEARFVREGECGWVAATAGSLRQRRSDEALGFSRNTEGLAGGFQREIAGGWHVGAAFGVEHATLDAGGIASTQGDQVQVGAMLKWRRGETTFSAGLEAGAGRYTTQRVVDLPGGSVVAASDPNVEFVGAHLRLAHAFPHENWYLRPLLDLGATRVNQRGFDERGAGAADLTVQGASQVYWTLRPALEIGGEWKRADGALLRPFVRVGALQLLSGSSPQVQASLQGAPAGIAPFAANGSIDRTIGELAVGVDLLQAGGTVLRFGYAGQFSSRIESHSAVLKVSMPF